MIIGTVWVVVWSFIYEASRKRKDNRILVITVGFALTGMFVFKDPGYYKVVGALTGLLIGYLTESRFIKFKVRASLSKQVLKVVFGLMAVYVLRLILKSVLPEILISDFLRYFILILWVTIVTPLIFKGFSAKGA